MKKSKVTGGTFAIVYHSVTSKPLPYDATPEQIDKASRQLVAKVKRKERAEAELKPRTTQAPTQ